MWINNLYFLEGINSAASWHTIKSASNTGLNLTIKMCGSEKCLQNYLFQIVEAFSICVCPEQLTVTKHNSSIAL
jgi:hypothetical protein